MKQTLPCLSILLGASLWGLIGLFNRGLTAAGLSAQTIVAVRNLGGWAVLTLVLLAGKRQALKVKLRHLPYFFGTGVVSVVLFTLCYFSCQQMASLAAAAILLYTSPAFVVVLSALLWRDRITPRKLLALALAFLGCGFVSGLGSGGLALTPLSLGLGVASGFFYGLYSIFARYALAHYAPLTVTYYTFLFAGLGSLPLIRTGELGAFSQSGPVWLAFGLVVVATVLPYLLYTGGLAKVDSGRAAILASVEPAVAALVGVLAFQEPMSPGILSGLGCILATVYLLRPGAEKENERRDGP